MIKKYLVIIYSLLKKILYLNNTRNIKSDTWKSKRVSDKFYNVHNLNQKIFFIKLQVKFFKIHKKRR